MRWEEGKVLNSARRCLPSPPALSQMCDATGCLTSVSWEREPKPRRNRRRVNVRWHAISALKHGVMLKRSHSQTAKYCHREERLATWHREAAAQAHLAACTVSDVIPETRGIASSKTPRNDGGVGLPSDATPPPPKNTSAALPSLSPPFLHAP